MQAADLTVTPGVDSRTCVVVVRGREPSLGGVWSSSGNSGAFRLVRGAITGQKSQSVRGHEKVRRKEKLRCRKAIKATCLPAQSARQANPTRVGRDRARRSLLRVYGRRSQRLSSRFGGWCAKLLLSHTSPSEVTPTPVNSPIRDDPSAYVT